jgi:hypothetical protein
MDAGYARDVPSRPASGGSAHSKRPTTARSSISLERKRVQGEYLADVRSERTPRSWARLILRGRPTDSPLADDAVAPDRSHAHHRHVGPLVAFRPVMFAAGIHATGWSLQGTRTGVRAIALMRLAAWYVRKSVCGLRGHDMVLHFEPERLSLQCLACGVRTHGWTIDVNPVYRRPRRQIGSQTVHRLDRGSLHISSRQYESDSRGEQLTAAWRVRVSRLTGDARFRRGLSRQSC